MKSKKHSTPLYVSIFTFFILERALGSVLIFALASAGFDAESERNGIIFYWAYQAFRGILALGLGIVVARWELLKPWAAALVFGGAGVAVQLFRDFRKSELPSSWDDWVFGVGFLFLIFSIQFAAGMAVMCRFRATLKP